MRLMDLKTNCPATLLTYGDLAIELRKKLISMGLRQRSQFTITRKAPLHGPWQIKVKNSSFTVRIDDIKNITVKLLSDE